MDHIDSFVHLGFPALHAEVRGFHSGPYEAGEAFFITRWSHHFGPGKLKFKTIW